MVYEWDERDLRKQQVARDLVSKIGTGAIVSSQVLQEFAAVMRTKLNANTNQIRSIIASYRGFGFVAVDAGHIEIALGLADQHSLSFWDALIVETAARSGCKTLYTEDLSDGQVIQGVRIINPFEI